MFQPRLLLVASSLLLGLGQPGWGIQLRSYTAARHDRFTGYPAAPAWNDAAWFGSRSYSGVGWAAADLPFQRQFALVSPQHLVGATHYQPNLGSVIRFLNGSGSIVERTVVALTPIQNDLNQNTDLTVITLASPLLPADQVAHFPYLNLASEADYLNTALVVFGWHVKAGRGRLAGFKDLEEAPLNRTRTLRFDYSKLFGDPDDAYLETGDSGSPSFAVVGGRPALLGIHTAVDEDPLKRSNFDTFVPHYAAQLNAVLAPAGYQMTPAVPPVVSLTATQTTTPVQWRQANPGSCQFDVVNRSATAATNVAVELRFTAAAVPQTLTAPGWLITPAGGGTWWLRRATLPASATVSITADWADLGLGDSVNSALTLVADGSARQSYEFGQQLAPSYSAWAVALTDKAPTADPDGDGVVNLLEYAFGGDPLVNSNTAPTGGALLPVLRLESGVATLQFPIREDAAVRGLAYLVEFSETLAGGSWTTTQPPGTALSDAPFTPAVAGWLHRTLTFDANAVRQFGRLRVELNENP